MFQKCVRIYQKCIKDVSKNVSKMFHKCIENVSQMYYKYIYSNKTSPWRDSPRMSLKTFFTNLIKSYLCTGSKCFSSLLGVLAVVIHILVIPVAVRADPGGQLLAGRVRPELPQRRFPPGTQAFTKIKGPSSTWLSARLVVTSSACSWLAGS